MRFSRCSDELSHPDASVDDLSPPKPERSGVGPERALEANTPTPSRKARKLILLKAYSASGGLMPRSPAMRRSFRTHRFWLCLTRGSTPGWYAVPRWGTPKACQPNPAEHTKTVAERCRAGASLGGEHPNPSRTARKLIWASSEPTQRAEA